MNNVNGLKSGRDSNAFVLYSVNKALNDESETFGGYIFVTCGQCLHVASGRFSPGVIKTHEGYCSKFSGLWVEISWYLYSMFYVATGHEDQC